MQSLPDLALDPTIRVMPATLTDGMLPESPDAYSVLVAPGRRYDAAGLYMVNLQADLPEVMHVQHRPDLGVGTMQLTFGNDRHKPVTVSLAEFNAKVLGRVVGIVTRVGV